MFSREGRIHRVRRGLNLANPMGLAECRAHVLLPTNTALEVYQRVLDVLTRRDVPSSSQGREDALR
jgi:hypothetical protein